MTDLLLFMGSAGLLFAVALGIGVVVLMAFAEAAGYLQP